MVLIYVLEVEEIVIGREYIRKFIVVFVIYYR